MEILKLIFFALVALFILVSFHEFGHYWVARRCGVKVLRFSIGFGPVLFKKTTSQTEFALSAIPLGGYVKMFGEGAQQTEEELSDEEKAVSYSHKTVWQRMAIVVAGPVANFILAVVFYFAVFSGGLSGIAPIVGAIESGSIAEQAGLPTGAEILSVDGETTDTWDEVFDALIPRVGDTGTLAIQWSSDTEGSASTANLRINRWQSEMDNPNLLGSLGIEAYRPTIEAVVGELTSGSPAERAGLVVGDRFVKIGEHTIQHWGDLVEVLRGAAGETLDLWVDRNGQTIRLELTPATVTEGGETFGRAGVGPGKVALEWDPALTRKRTYSPFEAASEAVSKTWGDSVLILATIKKMIVGDVSAKSIGGPITIAKAAGDTASAGWQWFFRFIAFLSVTLAVMNLLPIPVLDGGHLLFYIIEAVKGSPLSEAVQSVAMRFGMMAVFSLMIFAIYNDFTRL